MAPPTLRIGLIGAGANMRARHIPGLKNLPQVEIVAVCNRRPDSTAAVAREFNIPRQAARWQDLVADPNIDAIVIGTWPYLHCPITLAALQAGKHVLTEARMALNAGEAHNMLAAARCRPDLVAQVVPSPYGLKGHIVMKELLAEGFLGELRDIHLFSLNAALADAAEPLSWRQDAALSGFNMLTLGILHETLLRWVPPPVRVLAQVHAHISTRIDPESGVRRSVGTPDSVQVLTALENGVQAIYHLSGMIPFGQGMGIRLYGSQGMVFYDLAEDRIYGASSRRGNKPGEVIIPPEISIPPEKAVQWRVEADFVDAIRQGQPIEFTDFATGVSYMEFTEAVARSAQRGETVDLPLDSYSSHGGN